MIASAIAGPTLTILTSLTSLASLSNLASFDEASLMMAASCNGGPCVSVYTDPITHQIVITANQNTPGSVAAKPKPTRAPVVHRPVAAKPKPKPVTWIPYAPRPTRSYTYKPTVKKVVHKTGVIAAVTTAAVNLSDQITKLLPGSHLLYQPAADPLAGVPVYFWSDAGSIFNIATSILGIGVNVALQPSFSWDFGDGTQLTTNNPGGPYPNKNVLHTYAQSGNYLATLNISWAGTWAAQGSVLPVLGGALVQTVTATINVGPGPTNYTS
jgi:hypothetical protein